MLVTGGSRLHDVTVSNCSSRFFVERDIIVCRDLGVRVVDVLQSCVGVVGARGEGR